jgi:hypothetical protein
MKLIFADLVDQEGASGMFQCRIWLGVVLNRWSCGALRGVVHGSRAMRARTRLSRRAMESSTACKEECGARLS